MPETILKNGQESVPAERTIKVISHSNLLYWWPVWAFGFLMAFWTYLDDHRLSIVPAGTVADAGRQVEGFEGPRDVLVLPLDRQLPRDEAA